MTHCDYHYFQLSHIKLDKSALNATINQMISLLHTCSISRSTRVTSGFIDIAEELREPLLESTNEASKALRNLTKIGQQQVKVCQLCCLAGVELQQAFFSKELQQ